MKITLAEKLMFIIAMVQAVLVMAYGHYDNSYPKIYEDILGMAALFMLIIFSFIRETLSNYKKEKQ